MPEISIIVPVYNAQDFLGECIESVLSQSFTDWELILVDDSSSDSSLAICRSYAAADRRIIVLAAEKGGVSAARNKGIRASTGRFISFLDSDDTLLPDALSALRKHASDRSIVVGQYINTAIHPGVPEMDMPDSARTTSSEDAVVRTLYQDSLYHNAAVAKLYPRGIFDGNGFEEKRRYEDLESCPRFYLKAESVVMLKTPVYWYRRNPGSFINTLTADRTDALWASDMILELMQKECSQAVAAARSRRFSAYYNIYGLAVRAGDKRLQERCLTVIRNNRMMVLADPRVRIKNKIGAAISFLGPAVMRLACRRIY